MIYSILSWNFVPEISALFPQRLKTRVDVCVCVPSTIDCAMYIHTVCACVVRVEPKTGGVAAANGCQMAETTTDTLQTASWPKRQQLTKDKRQRKRQRQKTKENNWHSPDCKLAKKANGKQKDTAAGVKVGTVGYILIPCNLWTTTDMEYYRQKLFCLFVCLFAT